MSGYDGDSGEGIVQGGTVIGRSWTSGTSMSTWWAHAGRITAATLPRPDSTDSVLSDINSDGLNAGSPGEPRMTPTADTEHQVDAQSQVDEPIIARRCPFHDRKTRGLGRNEVSGISRRRTGTASW